MKNRWKVSVMVLCIIPLLFSCDIFQPPFDPVAFFTPMYNAFRILVQTTPIPEISDGIFSDGFASDEQTLLQTFRANGPEIPQSIKNFATQYIHLGGTATRDGEAYELAEWLLYMICIYYDRVTMYGINEGTLPVTMQERSGAYLGDLLPAYLRTVYFTDLVFRINPEIETEKLFVTALWPFMKYGDKPYIMTIWEDDLPGGGFIELPIFPIPYFLIFFL